MTIQVLENLINRATTARELEVLGNLINKKASDVTITQNNADDLFSQLNIKASLIEASKDLDKFDFQKDACIGWAYMVYSKYGGEFKVGDFVPAVLVAITENGSKWDRAKRKYIVEFLFVFNQLDEPVQISKYISGEHNRPNFLK